MQRYFVEEDLLSEGQSVTLEGEIFHHVSRVMRMQSGQEIYLVGGNQVAYVAEINRIDDKMLQARLLRRVEENKELPVTTTLFVCLPKGDKFDLIAQKTTELGVDYIVPVASRYAITKWTSQKAGKKISRLQKICQQAAEQSHRTVIPQVLDLMTVDQVAKSLQAYDGLLIAFEETAKAGQHGQLKESLKAVQAGQHLAFFFGPEGGIHPDEVACLIQAGSHVKLCSLGPRILRAETAPLYALTALSYELEL
ncbi:16S rRNA (uracil(1498)-N(3))-methyltransferase [Aerococcus kribbianus]|uniref:Ribosomal RNA small subunit methyltransferase E n=1 Tax=Aerococcus kribbianus TaxID=2999064 RepID=A0A9X3FMF7_9LACT|nr:MULTISPECIES: 16S rRNA (uracil(1498)-N(3))-methyltransferase [unclassified Aerococcus]MCZ0716934.1 16S rRNA (uracil(1498)-N(3))-methyltransferase [Aerococcus sp. YH-aer221]MCZ0725222.1 16S rRNA (uracil(1498)-N(3))-methyltransferase [Aerococcus sp. YH-aer222]